MTGPAVNTNPQTETAAGETARFPETGPTEALNHLHSQLTPEKLKDLSTQTLTQLSSELQKAEAMLAAAILERRKQAFLDTYSVKVLDGGPHQVSISIPKGKSWMDLIEDADNLAPALYNRPGVYPDRLAIWRNDQEFTQVVTQDTSVAVEGCVPHSTDMTRDEHETKERNWNDVDIRDLAAAHQAFFIATGKDLFDDNVVRARGCALYFDSDGLGVHVCFDYMRYKHAAASRSLSPRIKNLIVESWFLVPSGRSGLIL